jgi:hypothetical protein
MTPPCPDPAGSATLGLRLSLRILRLADLPLVKSLGRIELTNATLSNDLDKKALKSGRFADLDEVKRAYTQGSERWAGQCDHADYCSIKL